MERETVQDILNEITFRDWKLYLGSSENRLYIQAQFIAPDSFTGLKTLQKGRKWFLSEHMVRQEIVRTAFKAVEGAIIHELEEDFRFRGKAIYGPHIDPIALLEIADRTEERQ